MDLRALTTDAREDLRALDPARTVELTGPGGVGPPGPAPVQADEARLRQIITNLVGNAAATRRLARRCASVSAPRTAAPSSRWPTRARA